MKLVFFVGHAGTGKSTLAKEIIKKEKAVYLDTDTVSNRYTETLLRNAGLDINDRDSSYFKENYRDLVYLTTMDIAMENLQLNQDVFLVGPYTKEMMTPNYIKDLLEDSGLNINDVDVKIVRVVIEDFELQKKRILARKTERDNYKLANWDEFTTRLKSLQDENWISWDLPEENILVFDNSDEFSEEKIESILKFIKK